MGITSFDPISGRTLEAVYNPLAGKTKAKKATAKTTKKPAKTRSADALKDVDFFTYNGVTDQGALEQLARRVYEERSRQEIQGRVVTVDMAAETAGGDAPGEPMTADALANGRTILARLGGLVRHVPKRGTRVVVVFPGSGALGRPAFEAPGAAVILTVIGEDPPRFFGRAKTVLDFGDDEVVIRARSIALVCEAKREDGSVARHLVSVSGMEARRW